MNRFSGFIGILVLLSIAYLLSNNRNRIKKEIIFWGLSLQFIFAIIILRTTPGKHLFTILDLILKKIISFSDAGSDFLFKSFQPDVGYHPALINFAFKALPIIIFFSSLVSFLYYFGIIQYFMSIISFIMRKTMKTSPAETLSVSANIFIGQTESPIIIKPYIDKMTKSEIMTIMVGGFSTVAGSVMALYVSWLNNIPGIAGHLLAASVMSAPAAILISKIIYPETEVPETFNKTKIKLKSNHHNALEAISSGATDGLKLAANVAAMLIAFLSFIALFNFILNTIGISLQQILGTIFQPLAWSMGVPWQESFLVGNLMGQKLILTELIAYSDLSIMLDNNLLSQKSAIIASYALCGFANFGSIGIQIGGIGSIAPKRRNDITKIAIKAMIGGAIASWMTATIAGILI